MGPCQVDCMGVEVVHEAMSGRLQGCGGCSRGQSDPGGLYGCESMTKEPQKSAPQSIIYYYKMYAKLCQKQNLSIKITTCKCKHSMHSCGSVFSIRYIYNIYQNYCP